MSRGLVITVKQASRQNYLSFLPAIHSRFLKRMASEAGSDCATSSRTVARNHEEQSVWNAHNCDKTRGLAKQIKQQLQLVHQAEIEHANKVQEDIQKNEEVELKKSELAQSELSVFTLLHKMPSFDAAFDCRARSVVWNRSSKQWSNIWHRVVVSLARELASGMGLPSN